MAEHPIEPLTNLTLFVCTYAAGLSGIKCDMVKFTDLICKNIETTKHIVAVNSNFGHASKKNYEQYLKTGPKTVKNPKKKKKERVGQGDMSSFHSAVEPIIEINHAMIKPGKVYKTKCFPTTGLVQIPGVTFQDLGDAVLVLNAFIEDLDLMGIKDVKIAEQGPKMLNFRFAVKMPNAKAQLNLINLTAYLKLLDSNRIGRTTDIDPFTEKFHKWKFVRPPCFICETEFGHIKSSAKFVTNGRGPRIEVFQRGKINILGDNSFESSREIYQFFVELFSLNWNMLVCFEPMTDREKEESKKVVICPPVSIDDVLSLLDDLGENVESMSNYIIKEIISDEEGEAQGDMHPPMYSPIPHPPIDPLIYSLIHPSMDPPIDLFEEDDAVLYDLLVREMGCNSIEDDEEDSL